MRTPVHFLLVEGNPGDVRLTQEYFKEAGILHNLSIVNSTVKALEFLRQMNEYTVTLLPDIILCCILMLQEMAENDELLQFIQKLNIPIVALTAFEGELSGVNNHVPVSLDIEKPLTTERIALIETTFFGVAASGAE